MFKRLRFAGVSIVTLSEGEMPELPLGLKGTMNALFLKDFAIKTHRGIGGRLEAGKIGGGNAYGYRQARLDTTIRGPRQPCDRLRYPRLRALHRVICWNRQRQMKNPDTGRRVLRLNPESAWIRQETNRLNRQRSTSGETTRRELADAEKAIKSASSSRAPPRAPTARLTELEARQDELNARLSEAPTTRHPYQHP